jgi:hypothetical protein
MLLQVDQLVYRRENSDVVEAGRRRAILFSLPLLALVALRLEGKCIRKNVPSVGYTVLLLRRICKRAKYNHQESHLRTIYIRTSFLFLQSIYPLSDDY